VTNEDDELSSLVESVSVKLAQATSRHSFLAVAGKVLLATVGATVLVPILPFDRRIDSALASEPCSFWEYCDLCGFPCDTCSGGQNACPLCADHGGSWTACCNTPDFPPNCYYITYTDCCAPYDIHHGCNACPSCGTCCSPDGRCNCKKGYCLQPCYVCTVITRGASCGPCPFRP
jgi:hypothetical protein